MASLILITFNTQSSQFGSAFGDVGELVAGATGTGAVPQNLVYFTVSGTANFAACANAATPHFVVDKDDGGETIVTLLLAAKMANKKVHVAGRGTCAKINGHEDVSLLYID